MKIGYYITRFPYKNHFEKYDEQYACAGAEFTAYHLAVNMARRGHEVNVYTSAIDSKDSVESCEGVTVYRYGTNFRVQNANISLGLFRRPQEYPLDIIHAHFAIPPASLAGLWHAWRKRIPYMITYHADVPVNGPILRRTLISIYNLTQARLILSQAKFISTFSQFYINQSKLLGGYSEKVVAVPSGINLEDFRFLSSKEVCRQNLSLPTEGHIVLFFGALTPRKGPDILLRAMSKVLESTPDTTSVFAGDGVLRNELELLSGTLGLSKHVRFTGFVPDDLKPSYYRAADIFVLPSVASSESFGLVNLEAMACGTPVIASRIGGIPFLVEDGKNGLLVPPGDESALAEAIVHLLANDELRDRMACHGLQKAEQFSWARTAEETERVYKRLHEDMSAE